jgi:hypothetical protein
MTSGGHVPRSGPGGPAAATSVPRVRAVAAWPILAAALACGPVAASAQVFLASRSNPEFKVPLA